MRAQHLEIDVMQQVLHSRYAQSSTGPGDTTAADDVVGYTLVVAGLVALALAPGVVLGAVLGAGTVTLGNRLRGSTVPLAGFTQKEAITTAGPRTSSCQ